MKIINALLLAVFLFSFNGCQTVEKKTQNAIKKENEKLSKFIGQPVSELKIVLGNPDDEGIDEKGSKLLIYKTKKYTIKCERAFEINEVDMVVGFTSKGCF